MRGLARFADGLTACYRRPDSGSVHRVEKSGNDHAGRDDAKVRSILNEERRLVSLVDEVGEGLQQFLF